MITAQEALQRSQSVLTGKAKEQIEEIERKINAAVLKGETEINGYGAIIEGVQTHLEANGYTVISTFYRNEHEYKVLWIDPK